MSDSEKTYVFASAKNKKRRIDRRQELTWPEWKKQLWNVTQLPGENSKDFARAYIFGDLAVGSKKTKENIGLRYAVCVEFDGADGLGVSADEMRDIRDRAQGYEHFGYTTASSPHLQTGLFKFRLLFPLSRPVDATEWSKVMAGAVALFPEHDKKCRNILFYAPASCTPEDVKLFEGGGELLSAEDLIELAPEIVEKPPPQYEEKDESAFPPIEQRLLNARTKIASLPIAVQGEDGSGITMLAASLCYGYALPREQGEEVFREYCARCDPPWENEGEIQHKLDDAYDKNTKPWGYCFLDAQTFSNLMKALSANKVKPEVIQQAISELSLDDVYKFVNQFSNTDRGLVTRLAHHKRNRFRYIEEQKSWLKYSKGVWAKSRDPEKCLLKLIGDYEEVVAHGIALEKEKNAGEQEEEGKKKKSSLEVLKDWLTKCQGGSHYLSLMSLITRTHCFSSSIKDFDKTADTLNCKNGTVDLKTGVLHKHRARDYYTAQANASYVPGSNAGYFRKFVEQIMPDEKERRYFQTTVGMTLTGKPSKAVRFLQGAQGNNGKSTVMEILLDVFGNYGVTLSANIFSKGDRHPAELMVFKNARLAVMPDVDKNVKIDHGVFKRLSGGDSISARGMGENFQTFKPTHTSFLSMNARIGFTDFSKAFSERLCVIDFPVTFTGKQIDMGLKERVLEKDRDGVLDWCFEGLRIFQTEGLVEPETVTASREEWSDTEDELASFIEDRLIKTEGKVVTFKQVTALYADWMKDFGLEGRNDMLGSRQLSRELLSRGFKRKRVSSGFILLDVEIKPKERAVTRFPAKTN